MAVEAVGAGPHVRTDDAELPDLEIVQAKFRRNADTPVDGLEAGIAVKQVEGEAKRLVKKELLAAAEEIAAAGLGGTDVAWGRNAASVEEGFRRADQAQKGLLAEDRGPDGLVPLELVAVKGVEPAGSRVGILAFLRVAAIVGLL